MIKRGWSSNKVVPFPTLYNTYFSGRICMEFGCCLAQVFNARCIPDSFDFMDSSKHF